MSCGARPRFGDACCAGATCTESTCLNGRCAVFGGSYTYNAYDGVCGSGNPLAGNACMCPVGFTARNVEDVDYNVDEGMGWLNELHTCVVSGSPGASVDFAGAHGRITTGYPGSMGCTDSCTAPAGTTGTCTCPPGTTASTYQGIHFLSGTSMDCEREVTYCTGTAAPLSYGGSFWRHVTGRDLTCDSGLAPGARCIPNPRTGACSCPAGFIEQVSSMMQRRIIDRGSGPENWTCRGDLVVCQRLP